MSLMGQTVLKLAHFSCLILLFKVTIISGENPAYLGCVTFLATIILFVFALLHYQ